MQYDRHYSIAYVIYCIILFKTCQIVWFHLYLMLISSFMNPQWKYSCIKLLPKQQEIMIWRWKPGPISVIVLLYLCEKNWSKASVMRLNVQLSSWHHCWFSSHLYTQVLSDLDLDHISIQSWPCLRQRRFRILLPGSSGPQLQGHQ